MLRLKQMSDGLVSDYDKANKDDHELQDDKHGKAHAITNNNGTWR